MIFGVDVMSMMKSLNQKVEELKLVNNGSGDCYLEGYAVLDCNHEVSTMQRSYNTVKFQMCLEDSSFERIVLVDRYDSGVVSERIPLYEKSEKDNIRLGLMRGWEEFICDIVNVCREIRHRMFYLVLERGRYLIDYSRKYQSKEGRVGRKVYSLEGTIEGLLSDDKQIMWWVQDESDLEEVVLEDE